MSSVLEEVRKESEQRTLYHAIKNVMETLGVGVDKAMDTLKIPTDQRTYYANWINPQATG